jgi:DNA-binding NtrC family response regulator
MPLDRGSFMSSPEPRGLKPDMSALQGARVLVVEDAWHVAEAMKLVLQQVGISVIGPAANVPDATRLITSHELDLALVDINLKQETAVGVIDELHARGIPLIIVSGYAVPPVSMEKAAAFVQKPFSARELMVAISRVIGRLQ